MQANFNTRLVCGSEESLLRSYISLSVPADAEIVSTAIPENNAQPHLNVTNYVHPS